MYNKVRVIKDYDYDIWEGTILQNVKIIGDSYYGLWTSRGGSYYVSVPMSYCEPVDD